MITLRLGLFQKDKARAAELCEAIRRHRGSCDTVWLSTIGYYPSLDYHRGLAAEYVPIAKMFREAGVRVSLHIANTIGHGDFGMLAPENNSPFMEGMRASDGMPYDSLVGADGRRSTSCFCWRGKHIRAYLREVISIYAAALQPERVWLDDDLRAYRHSKTVYGCFCDSCIQSFNAQHGTDYTREALVHEMNYGDVGVRERYVNFCKQGLYELNKELSLAALAAAPESAMGLEHGHFSNYLGIDENYHLQGLYDGGGKAVHTRPGGGYYNDKAPFDQYRKIFDLSHQVSFLPNFATDRIAELENLPGVAFGKSLRGILNEGTLDLAIGCTGLSYTDLQSCHEPMAYYERLLRATAEQRPYWERLSAISRSGHRCGVCVYESPQVHLRPLSKGEEPFAWTAFRKEREISLLRLGVPLTFDRRGDRCYILKHDRVDAMSDAEIERLLTRPVLCDAESVHRLIRRGYGQYFPFSMTAVDDENAMEIFPAHPVNAKTSGNLYVENPYAAQIGARYVFGETDARTEVIGEMHHNPLLGDGSYIGACTVITELARDDGKHVKWAIFGYSLWNDIVSSAKREQIVGALDAIAPMAARIFCDEPAVVIPSANDQGQVLCITVAAAGQGGLSDATLAVRNAQSTRITLMGVDRAAEPITATEEKKGELLIRLPHLSPYEVVTLFFEA